MKKLFFFICLTILLGNSLYSMQRLSFQKIRKNIKLKSKKLNNQGFLKKYYSGKLNAFNPFTFMRNKLRELWVNYTFRYISLSRAHKLYGADLTLYDQPFVKGLEKQNIMHHVVQNLKDFYKNYFLEIIIYPAMHTVERTGNMVNFLVEGKYLHQETKKNEFLLDYIFTSDVSEDIIDNSVFRVTYDIDFVKNLERNTSMYNFTQNVQKIFEDLFEHEKNAKRLKPILRQFCTTILDRALGIEKYGLHRIQFFELLTALRKKKLISNTYPRDEIIALRMILQGLISVLKTIHIHIIPKKTAEIKQKHLELAEKKVQEKIKKLTEVIEEIIKASTYS